MHIRVAIRMQIQSYAGALLGIGGALPVKVVILFRVLVTIVVGGLCKNRAGCNNVSLQLKGCRKR